MDKPPCAGMAHFARMADAELCAAAATRRTGKLYHVLPCARTSHQPLIGTFRRSSVCYYTRCFP